MQLRQNQATEFTQREGVSTSTTANGVAVDGAVNSGIEIDAVSTIATNDLAGSISNLTGEGQSVAASTQVDVCAVGSTNQTDGVVTVAAFDQDIGEVIHRTCGDNNGVIATTTDDGAGSECRSVESDFVSTSTQLDGCTACRKSSVTTESISSSTKGECSADVRGSTDVDDVGTVATFNPIRPTASSPEAKVSVSPPAPSLKSEPVAKWVPPKRTESAPPAREIWTF